MLSLVLPKRRRFPPGRTQAVRLRRGRGLYDTFGNLGFRPAADAQYIAAGPAYSGSDSEWLEVAAGSDLTIFVR